MRTPLLLVPLLALLPSREALARAPIHERMAAFDTLFGDAERSAAPGRPQCGTSILWELRARWTELSPEERHRVEVRTNPFYRAWLADGGFSWLEGDVWEAAGARQACFTPQAIDNGYGPYQQVDSSEHFLLHWSPAGSVTQGRAQNLQDWLEESYEIETSELGFHEPNLAETYQLNVMVEDLGSDSVGAYTSYFPCGSQYMPFVVVNSRWFGDTSTLKSTAPHELFHTIQIVYGMDEFFFNQGRNEWWIEATATYTETVVFPTLYEPEIYQALRWSSEPWRSMETADDGGFQYGLWVVPKSIEASLGGPEWHQQLWDQIDGRSDFELRDELDELLAEHGTSFIEEWQAFVRRGATMDFGWNARLIGPFEVEALDIDPGGDDIDVDDLPILDAIDGDFEPEYLGASYLRIPSDGVDSDQAIRLRVRPVGEEDGDTIEWVASAVAYEEDDSMMVGTTYEPVVSWDFEFLPVEDEGGQVVEWFGEVVLNDFGDDYDGVILAASPTTDFGNGTMSWYYDLEIIPNVAEDGFSADAAVEDDGGDGGGAGSACGTCHTTGSGAQAGMLVLAAIPWALRRRRSAGA